MGVEEVLYSIYGRRIVRYISFEIYCLLVSGSGCVYVCCMCDWWKGVEGRGGELNGF